MWLQEDNSSTFFDWMLLLFYSCRFPILCLSFPALSLFCTAIIPFRFTAEFFRLAAIYKANNLSPQRLELLPAHRLHLASKSLVGVILNKDLALMLRDAVTWGWVGGGGEWEKWRKTPFFCSLIINRVVQLMQAIGYGQAGHSASFFSPHIWSLQICQTP